MLLNLLKLLIENNVKKHCVIIVISNNIINEMLAFYTTLTISTTIPRKTLYTELYSNVYWGTNKEHAD